VVVEVIVGSTEVGKVLAASMIYLSVREIANPGTWYCKVHPGGTVHTDS